MNNLLKDLFISEVRLKLLKITLPQPNSEFHVRGLVRLVGTEINAVRRELQKLETIGVLRKRQSGNRIYYRAEPSNMYYAELLAMLAKDEGICADIIKNQKKLGDIKYAMVSRAFLRGRVPTHLDVDLFIVGKVNNSVLKEIITTEEQKIGREINYTVMDEDEFMFLKRKNDTFIAKLLTQSRTMLIGDEEQFSSIF